jgi:hypothetical protein
MYALYLKLKLGHASGNWTMDCCPHRVNVQKTLYVTFQNTEQDYYCYYCDKTIKAPALRLCWGVLIGLSSFLLNLRLRFELIT